MNDTIPTQPEESQPIIEITPKEAMETTLPDGGLSYDKSNDRFIFDTDKRTARLIAMRLHIVLDKVPNPEEAMSGDAWVQMFNEPIISDIRLDGAQFSFIEPKYSFQTHTVILLRNADRGHFGIEAYREKLSKILNITFDEKGISHPTPPPTTPTTL